MKRKQVQVHVDICGEDYQRTFVIIMYFIFLHTYMCILINLCQIKIM